MRRIQLILSAIVTASLCVPVLAQKPPRRLPGLVTFYGPIQSIREEHSTFTQENGSWVSRPRVLQMEWTFSEDGTRQELTSYRFDGVMSDHRVDTYDADGTILETRRFNADNVMVTREVSKYDDHRRLIERVTYKPDDSISKRTVYHLDGNQLQMDTVEYDSNGAIRKQTSTTRTSQGTRADYDSLSVPSNGPVTRADYSEVRKPDGHDFQYQESNGQFRREVTKLGEKGTFERVFYNRDGTILRRDRFVQEFDSYGNMTKSTNSSAKGDSQNYEPTGVTYRTITYYRQN